MTQRFGLSVAAATPFTASGSIDTALLLAQVRQCLAEGCSSATLFGTTGEGPSVGAREREAVFSALLAGGIAPHQLVAGVIVNAADDAAAQSAAALAMGARAVLLAPPHYFKGVNDDGLFAWFGAVLAALGSNARNILLYHIPSVTMTALSLPLISRLMKAFPAIVGVKDSGGDFAYTGALLAAHCDKVILIGDERHLAQGVRLGGQGAISGLANLVAPALRSVVDTGADDARLPALVEAVLRHPVTPAVKALVGHVRHDTRWLAVRPPLVALDDVAQKAVIHAYETHFTARPNGL